MNADGRADVVAGGINNARVHLLLNLGGGSLAAPRTFIADWVRLGVADVDADGDLDLALPSADPDVVSVLFNGVAGGFSIDLETRIVELGQEPHHAHLGDLNGDSMLDCITGNGDNRTYSILLNDGSGDFLPAVTTRVDVLTETGIPKDLVRHDYVQTGDVDGDGQVDIVLADAWQQVMRVLPNRGDGTFEEFMDWPVGKGPFQFRLTDLERDGDLDVFTIATRDNVMTLLFNDGNGDFSQRVDLSAGDGPAGIDDGDLDGDGDLDFAVANTVSSDVSIFLSNGDGTFAERVDYSVPGGPRAISVADFDRDGDLDVATTNGETEDVAILTNRGQGVFGPPSLTIPVRLVPHNGTAADVNGDGFVDLVVANERNDTISVILGKGDGTFQPAFQKDNSTGTGLRFVLAGDLDLDGDIDLVAANRGSQDLTYHENRLERTSPPDDFTETICTGLDFHRWSIAARGGSAIERSMKYIVPAREDDSLLGTLFQNVQRFPLHQDFLQGVFPDRFPSLSVEGYNAITGRRATRDYFVGVIHRLRTVDGPAYGFSVIVDGSDSAELVMLEEVQGVFQTLSASFTLGPLGYFPDTNQEKERASAWVDPGFPIFIEDGPPGVSFEAYTVAVGYGRVRILDREGFDQANESGQISFQSVLVLEEAPRDIEGVVGGLITAQQQGPLSHVSIRTARRNTPNAFVADASEEFAAFEGKLVRLAVTSTEAAMEEATLEEAEAFWAENRPSLTELPTLEPEFAELLSLAEIAALDLMAPQESRFGGKATNLGRLGRTLVGSRFEELAEVGFGIPVHYYVEFMRTNKIPSAFDATREVTYEDYLTELFQCEEFQTDSMLRFEALRAFREFARENGNVNETLVENLIKLVQEIFPATQTEPKRVRFRSSSNVEDALEFNGAGLYESTAVCLADIFDDDEEGPSLCNIEQGEGERTIVRALKKVWTSIYTFRAFEERAFYGIPEELVGMGILCSRAFPNELANGVAFTGNFSNPLDRRFVVTAQVGDESVVSPEPGVLPERDVLEVNAEGVVTRIIRAQESTLVAEGEVVLSDDYLTEIGTFLRFVDENFPVDLGDHRRDEVLLDLEFKVEPDNTLAFKQVRPFLLSEAPPPTPTFALEIPEGTEICGAFALAGVDRGPLDEYRLKSVIRLRSGMIDLPTSAESFTEDLIEELRFGPEAEIAAPQDAGLFRLLSFAGPGGTTIYRFNFAQPFLLQDGRMLEVQIVSPITFTARGDESDEPVRVFDEEFFTARPGEEAIQATLDGAPRVRYGSCVNSNLPRFAIVAELEDGSSLKLEERFFEQESLFDTGPASLERAEVVLGGETRLVSEYWNLVYSAFRHNTRVRYWVVLDPPVTVPGVGGAVRAVEYAAAEPPEVPEPTAAYLGENFEILSTVGVRSSSKEPVNDSAGTSFRRGDVTADGGVDLGDGLSLLNYLFQRGDAPSCQESADANDDGRLNITDVLAIVSHLFGKQKPLPAPFAECGEDTTPDTLTCDGFSGCE